MTEPIKLPTEIFTNMCVGLSIQTLMLAIFNIVAWILPVSVFFGFEYAFLYSLYLCKILPELDQIAPQPEEITSIIIEGTSWLQNVLLWYRQICSHKYIQPFIQSTPALAGFAIFFYFHLPTASLLALGIVYIYIRAKFGKEMSHRFINIEMMLLSPFYAICRWGITQNIFYPAFLLFSIFISIFLNTLSDKPAENTEDHLLNYLILTITLGPLMMLAPNIPTIQLVKIFLQPLNRPIAVFHSLCATYLLGHKSISTIKKTGITASELIPQSMQTLIPSELNILSWFPHVQRPT